MFASLYDDNLEDVDCKYCRIIMTVFFRDVGVSSGDKGKVRRHKVMKKGAFSAFQEDLIKELFDK